MAKKQAKEDALIPQKPLRPVVVRAGLKKTTLNIVKEENPVAIQVLSSVKKKKKKEKALMRNGKWEGATGYEQ